MKVISGTPFSAWEAEALDSSLDNRSPEYEISTEVLVSQERGGDTKCSCSSVSIRWRVSSFLIHLLDRVELLHNESDHNVANNATIEEIMIMGNDDGL
jgi:hypothetical protein